MYTIERKTGGVTVKKTPDERLREELDGLKKVQDSSASFVGALPAPNTLISSEKLIWVCINNISR